jgi:hypothetical protein
MCYPEINGQGKSQAPFQHARFYPAIRTPE